MYNVHMLALVLAQTEPESYLALPPSPREIMRKGVFLGIGTCADFVDLRKNRRERRA